MQLDLYGLSRLLYQLCYYSSAAAHHGQVQVDSPIPCTQP